MSDFNPSTMTISQLVDHFADNGVAQDQALKDDEIDEFTRLYWQMDAIHEELKSRGDEARLALVTPYDHPNMQVRVQAARSTLAVAPVAARNTLEAVKNSRHFPQAGDAASPLSNLAIGFFTPT